MGWITYGMTASLDGYVADAQGNFDFFMPSEQLHRFFGDLELEIDTHLYGRRLFELMRFWETDAALDDAHAYVRDYAQAWRGNDTIVVSRTLPDIGFPRTQVWRELDVERIQALKEAGRRMVVGGPTLAHALLQAGLVDEVRVITVPVLVGGGQQLLPPGLHGRLDLMSTRTFPGGVTYAQYRVMHSAAHEGASAPSAY